MQNLLKKKKNGKERIHRDTRTFYFFIIFIGCLFGFWHISLIIRSAAPANLFHLVVVGHFCMIYKHAFSFGFHFECNFHSPRAVVCCCSCFDDDDDDVV